MEEDNREFLHAARGVLAPPIAQLRNSMNGFKAWLLRRPEPVAKTAETEVPDDLTRIAGELGRKVWEIAVAQAHASLNAERASVQAQVLAAKADTNNAIAARDASQRDKQELERRLAAAISARQETEAELKAARVHQEARQVLERQLADARRQQTELERQISTLQAALDSAVESREQDAAQQTRQLERAGKHYAELESQLSALLEQHKAARLKLERARD